MKIAGYLQASPVEEEHNAARRRCGGKARAVRMSRSSWNFVTAVLE